MVRRFARSKWLLPLVIAAAAAAMVSASVFVIYPVSGSLSFTSPPVKFWAGSNAGKADLSGTIDVTLGANNASATLALHPTYETTYYLDILRVNNTAAQTFYVKLNLSSSDLVTGEKIYVVIYKTPNNTPNDYTDDTYVATLELTSNGYNVTSWLPLDAGYSFRLDFKVVYPEGTALPSTAQSFALKVLYSNQNAENPPPQALS